jgi:hypothetical protein
MASKLGEAPVNVGEPVHHFGQHERSVRYSCSYA